MRWTFAGLAWLLISCCGAGHLAGQTAVPVLMNDVAKNLDAAAAATDPSLIPGFLESAGRAYDQLEEALSVPSSFRRKLPRWEPRGNFSVSRGTLGKAASGFRKAASTWDAGNQKGAQKIVGDAFETVEKADHQDALLTDGVEVAAVLLAVLALLFSLGRHPRFGRVFKVVPLLIFCYFVPTLLSNLHLIPIDAPVYDFIKKVLLPASLVLLVLSVDIPAILRLGPKAVILFLVATGSIVIGGPLAYWACSWFVPPEVSDEAWRGLAALSGSWIGGGANFVAMGDSFGASASTMGMMVVVDVGVANIWTAVLLFFAGRSEAMDARLGADRTSLDALRDRVETFEKKVSRPTALPDLLSMLALAIGATAIATALSKVLPTSDYVSTFTWVVLIVTTVAIVASFTRLRNIEGAGASKLGSALLYLLVASIGAHAQFSKLLEAPALVAIGAVWMVFHAAILIFTMRVLKAPVFFMAVGSQANVGGAASAPVVASAFHPALAPVGVLLAVAGYALGTYGGLACGALLKMVHDMVG